MRGKTHAKSIPKKSTLSLVFQKASWHQVAWEQCLRPGKEWWERFLSWSLCWCLAFLFLPGCLWCLCSLLVLRPGPIREPTIYTSVHSPFLRIAALWRSKVGYPVQVLLDKNGAGTRGSPSGRGSALAGWSRIFNIVKWWQHTSVMVGHSVPLNDHSHTIDDLDKSALLKNMQTD